MSNDVILVTGATGTVGGEVVRQLVAQGRRVRALVRNPTRAARLGEEIDLVTADLSRPETLGAAFAGVDRVFVSSNGLDIAALEGNAFDAAKDARVKQIVKHSGRHIDADFMRDSALTLYHARSEARLRALGIPWTILRPGVFASNFLMWLDGKRGGVYLPVGQGSDTPTDPRDVAAVAVKTLTEPGHEGAVYEITGPEYLSYTGMVQKLSNAIGTPLQLVDVSPDAAREGLLAAGIPPTQAEGLLRYFAGVRAGKIYPPTTTVADLLGRRPRSFDDWARDHRSLLLARSSNGS